MAAVTIVEVAVALDVLSEDLVLERILRELTPRLHQDAGPLRRWDLEVGEDHPGLCGLTDHQAGCEGCLIVDDLELAAHLWFLVLLDAA